MEVDGKLSSADLQGITAELMTAIHEMKNDVRTSVESAIDKAKNEIMAELRVEVRNELSKMKTFVLDEIQKAKHELRNELRNEFGEKFKTNEGMPTKSEKKLKWMAIEAESRSRRSNLMFFGIPESEGEDCTMKVQIFIKEKLKINDTVVLPRVHRVGPRKHGNIGTKADRPRPIIANFLDFRQRELVRAERKILDHGFGIAEDHPKAIRMARASLTNELLELKKLKKKVAVVWPARLLADGEVVRVADPTDYFDE